MDFRAQKRSSVTYRRRSTKLSPSPAKGASPATSRDPSPLKRTLSARDHSEDEGSVGLEEDEIFKPPRRRRGTEKTNGSAGSGKDEEREDEAMLDLTPSKTATHRASPNTRAKASTQTPASATPSPAPSARQTRSGRTTPLASAPSSKGKGKAKAVPPPPRSPSPLPTPPPKRARKATPAAEEAPSISVQKATSPPAAPSTPPRASSTPPRNPSPASPSRRQRVVKRMLSRTTSLPSASSLSSAKAFSSFVSPQPTPTSSPQRCDSTPPAPVSSPRRPPPVPVSAQAPAVAGPSQPLKRTYGKSRSFVVEVDPLSAPLPIEVAMRESYEEVRARYGVDNSDEDEDSTIDLKSLSELRTLGMDRRFSDELAYLLEGLTCDSAPGVKRASALDVVRKLTGAGGTEWKRKLGALEDGVERVWGAFLDAGVAEGDPTLDAIFALFLALLCTTPSLAAPLLRHGPTPLPVLGTILARPGSDALAAVAIGKAHVPGVSKPEKRILGEVASLARGAAELGWSEGGTVSLPGLISHALSAMSTLPPSASFSPPLLLSATPALSSTASCLLHALSPLSDRLDLHAKGLPLIDPLDPPDLAHADRCLRVLEACTTACEDAHEVLEREHIDLAGPMGALVRFAHILAADEDSKLAGVAMDCLIGVLRVLINLTNASKIWGEAVLRARGTLEALVRLIALSSTEPVCSDADANEQDATVPEDKNSVQALTFDLLCLALALLSNLVEGVESAAEAVRAAEIDLSLAPRSKAPLTPALDILTSLYIRQSQTAISSPSPDATFLAGYTALLLGHLLASPSGAARTEVLRRLPGGSARTLTEMLRGFGELHRRAAADAVGAVGAHEHEEETEGKEEEGRELGVRAAGGLGRTEEVVRGILEVIEGLGEGMTVTEVEMKKA